SMILLLLAFSERQGQRVADTYMDLLESQSGFDRRAFAQDIAALVSRYHDASGGRMALGTALLDLTKVAHAHRVPVPTAMTLRGMQRAANRLSLGVIAGSLLIAGSALLNARRNGRHGAG